WLVADEDLVADLQDVSRLALVDPAQAEEMGLDWEERLDFEQRWDLLLAVPGLLQDLNLSRMEDAAGEPIRGIPQPGRNDPCPCGSGRKWKKCCGTTLHGRCDRAVAGPALQWGMDSLTQILLGASAAAAVVPAGHRRAALAAGAALGTLPDLDSLPLLLLTDDPVALMTLHRGASHSLLALPWVAWAIWWFFRRRGGRVAQAPRRWFWAILLALLTHPLLDALTVYGTQLLWPLPLRPVMWSSLFIIAPAYTLWLLLGGTVALFAGPRPAARRALALGLALSTAY